MKQIKNIVRCIGCLLLVSVILCGTAFADVTSTPFPDIPADANYAKAATTLVEIGIFKGDDKGNFNPNNSITRAEAAAVICRLLGVEDEAKQMTNVVFTDVPASHWSVGYVAKTAELSIIDGYGNGQFGPEDSVTYVQMVKMLVCALNYGSVAEENGGWPQGYLSTAMTLGIIDEPPMLYNNAIPRSTVAVLVYHAVYG